MTHENQATQLGGMKLKLARLLTSTCSGHNPFLMISPGVAFRELRKTVASQGSLKTAAEIESM